MQKYRSSLSDQMLYVGLGEKIEIKIEGLGYLCVFTYIAIVREKLYGTSNLRTYLFKIKLARRTSRVDEIDAINWTRTFSREKNTVT